MNKELAPVALFCYKRLEVLQSTVTSLQKNYLANDTHLHVFSDGAKNPADQVYINQIRDYLKTIEGFKSVTIYASEANKGLARSIISGVTKIMEQYDRIIVLEDDLITSTNFLSFMNQALDFYEKKNVFSVAGFSFPMKGLPSDSVYFTRRASSIGWATWRDRWSGIDWDVRDYENFKENRGLRRRFNEMGSDLSSMLDKQIEGKMDSWAIRWCYHQFKIQSYTVHPAVSKISNNGFGHAAATHNSEKFDRFKTILDKSDNLKFNFTEKVEMDPKILWQAIKYYSIPYRVYFNIKKIVLSRA